MLCNTCNVTKKRWRTYDRALALKPDFTEVLNNRGTALKDLKRYEEALASYDRALAIKPGYAEAFYNRGLALQYLHRHQEALASYDRALALKPEYADALYNRGVALQHLRRHEEACRDLERALELKPDLPFAKGMLLYSRMLRCDWRKYEAESRQVVADVRAGKRGARRRFPFSAFRTTRRISCNVREPGWVTNARRRQRRCGRVSATGTTGFAWRTCRPISRITPPPI